MKRKGAYWKRLRPPKQNWKQGRGFWLLWDERIAEHAASEVLTFRDFEMRTALLEGSEWKYSPGQENPALDPDSPYSWRCLAATTERRKLAESEAGEEDDFLHDTIRDRAVGFATSLRYEDATASDMVPNGGLVRTPPRSLEQIHKHQDDLYKTAQRNYAIAKAVEEALSAEGFSLSGTLPSYIVAYRNSFRLRDRKTVLKDIRKVMREMDRVIRASTRAEVCLRDQGNGKFRYYGYLARVGEEQSSRERVFTIELPNASYPLSVVSEEGTRYEVGNPLELETALEKVLGTRYMAERIAEIEGVLPAFLEAVEKRESKRAGA